MYISEIQQKIERKLFEFRNCTTTVEKSFCFWDNCISIGCGKFSQVRKKYLLPAVNVLANSPKIWNVTKRDIFQLNLCQSD